MSDAITLELKTSIEAIHADDWQTLLAHLPQEQSSNPFIQHAFLKVLEQTESVCAKKGWQPCHLAFYEKQSLVAVLPNYIKAHSYGEYVFDWAWADAYQRHGLEYYPKSLTAVPLTPITGPRLMTSLAPEKWPALYRAAIQWAEQSHMSGWHINFVGKQEAGILESESLIAKQDIQFHWHNRDYTSFSDFLSVLKAKKRKNILRERRSFDQAGAGWTFEWLDGHSASAEDWALFDRMYRNTFDKKGGWAQLSENFFAACAKAMPEQTLLLLAKHDGEPLAGAFFMRSDDGLYGRYWGCFEEVEFLHFETCYYQGIEYAIKHQLALFEPGAQGEHKLARGFMPVLTRSFHHISHRNFREAIANAVAQEQEWIMINYQSYLEHSPYKED
ncbi:GNAT family N-acetyltransferase [Kangiella marina]|uniref:GNAT family N-acetyltransferase n=1 Tax=Kangiella marina TaxID=1079178 RepID=A0ABP8ICM0_9GAMM